MKKAIILLLMLSTISCTNNKFSEDHTLALVCCRDIADSMMCHISEDWKKYDSQYDFVSKTLYIFITDSIDSLIIAAEQSSGIIPFSPFEKRENLIKKHNDAVMRACRDITAFQFDTLSNKAISASYLGK